MTLKDIALLNLRRRKAKAGFVLAGLVNGAATLVAMFSLTEALTHEINHKLEKYGANILVTPRTESLSLSYEGLSLGGFSFQTNEIKQSELALIHQIKNAGNLAAVGPMVLGAITVGGREALLAGVDLLLDAGPTPGGPASTVPDCRAWPPTVLRAGAVRQEPI